MADGLVIRPSAMPWKPSEQVELEAVYNRYDHPLTGVIRQGGDPYLFHCILGHGQVGSLWVFALLEASEVDRLNKTEGDEFDQALRDALTGRELVIAVSSYENGLGFWIIVDPQPVAPALDSAEGIQATERLVNALLDAHDRDGPTLHTLRDEVEDLIPA